MRSKRVPDRVHVVRPPEQDEYSRSENGQSIQIVRMLAQISDKLKRGEAERYELLGELREYRKAIKELEEKSEYSEKNFSTLQNRLKNNGSVDTESFQRQLKFEKALKATEEKLVKTIAGQAVMDKRLKDSETKQAEIDQRLDQTLTEQARLGRQLEITSQDKSRLVRKLERLEEIVTDTRDSLNAKAMVLLTDQSTAAQAGIKSPSWGNAAAQSGDNMGMEDHAEGFKWSRFTNFQSVGLASMIIAALLGGWTLNQIQQPEVPQIAILENGGLARLNLDENRWEPVNTNTPENVPPPTQLTSVENLENQNPLDGVIEPAIMTPDETPENVLDFSDEQLMNALENDPEGLAAQLNNIEPSSTPPEQAALPEPSQAAPNLADPKITAPMKDFDKLAFKQDSKIQKMILAEKKTTPLASRMNPDSALPDVVQEIEKQAFAGNAEAQHDLAAIYTAGHGGVNQNFERASFWFREAADNGIANARYNLGVLFHQGLGQERNLDRALYWYREAAKLDHAEAQYNLGIAHIEGIGTDYDPRLAAAFFERAANNGIMEAAYNLGLIYENGLLGEAKPDEALLWYKIAADQGSPDAKSAMEQLAKNLQIDMKDVDKLVKRMQQINESVKGRPAGPDASAAPAQKKTPASKPVKSVATQSETKSSSVANSEQALVAQVQEYLMATGAYAGPADGVMGPMTAKAIRSYQTASGLPVDGRPTKVLLNHMVSGAVAQINAR